MGTKNWTELSARAAHALSCWAILLIPLANFWLSDSILHSIEQSLILNVHF